MMDIKHSFSENLKKYRKHFGLTQEQLGELTYMESIDTISRYETGKNFPSPENLQRLVETLNISYDDLLGDNDKKLEIKDKISKSIEFELKTLSDDERKLILALIRTYKNSKK